MQTRALHGQKSSDSFNFRCFVEYLEKYLTDCSHTHFGDVKNISYLAFFSENLVVRAIMGPTTKLTKEYLGSL